MNSLIARPVDLQAPSGFLGSANAKGYVQTWEEVGEADFGEGLSLPVRFGFSSDPNRRIGILGMGWFTPICDSRVFPFDQNTMEIQLICGKILYMHRNPDGSNHFHSEDGEWQGIQDRNNFSLMRDDGWMLRYEDGHVVELKTDKGRDILWNYNGSQLTSLSEGRNHPLTIKRDSTHKIVELIIAGKQHSFTIGQRPTFEMEGGIFSAKQSDALTSFQWPNGLKETFKYGATPTSASLETIDGKGVKRHYSWDSVGHILSDDDWTYTVGAIEPNSNLPSITRVNRDGEKESIQIATRTGVVTATDSHGVVTTTTLVRTPGPNFNKVHEITQTSGGETRILEQQNYDAAGRLTSSMDKTGAVTTYSYDSAGNLISQSTTLSPDVLRQLQVQESEILMEISKATDPKLKDDLLARLGHFYVHQMKVYDKALAVGESISNKGMGYPVCFEAILYDESLNNMQKIAAYKKLLPLYPQCSRGINGIIQTLQP